MSDYVVTFEGRQRDPTRVDAWQARLRVFRDNEYFQFVSAVVPGIDIVMGRVEQRGLREQFWRQVVVESLPLIKAAIRDRVVPLSDSSIAYEVFPDTQRALRRAAQLRAEPLREGAHIGTFRM